MRRYRKSYFSTPGTRVAHPGLINDLKKVDPMTKFGVTSNEIELKQAGQNKFKQFMFRAYPGWSLQGGFTWASDPNTLPEIGVLAGRLYTPYDSRVTFNTGFESSLNKTLSSRFKQNFTPGSILDYTQKLIDTQKSLMMMLGTMKPMLSDGKQLIETFNQMFGANAQVPSA